MRDREVLSDAASRYFRERRSDRVSYDLVRLQSAVQSYPQSQRAFVPRIREAPAREQSEYTEVNAPAVIPQSSCTLHRAELIDGYCERCVINFFDDALDEIDGLRGKSASMTVIRLTEEVRDTAVL